MKTSQAVCGQGPSLITRIRRGATGLRIGRPKARTAKAVGSFAVGSFVLGAFATLTAYVGSLAIGRLAVGRVAVGKGRIKRLQIDELEIGKFRFVEQESPVVPNGRLVRQPEMATKV